MIPNTNEARIETSTACNAACVFCPWPTDDFTRRKEIMSLKDYKFYNIRKCSILLSPAAASFDQFNNFESRGVKFKKLCKNYARKFI